MKKFVLAVFAMFLFTTCAHASLIGFATNVSSNSTDWANFVAGLGGTVHSNINFDTHPLGGLQSNFYSVSDGVTLIEGGSTGGNTVTFGSGPGQGNTSSGPTSAGEGLNPASNYYRDNSSFSSLTVNFNSNTLGGGLHIVDLFNPAAYNESSTLSAYTGVNGTGSLLGSVSAANFNFQNNNSYFFGVVSTDNDIRSLVYTDINGGSGDETGIDRILYAKLINDTPPDNQNDDPDTPLGTVPEPSTVALVSLGLAAAFLRRSRNGR